MAKTKAVAVAVAVAETDGADAAARGGAARWIGTAGRVGRAPVTMNMAENPLAWLLRRGKIDARQYAAGDRLRCDYELAGKGPSVTMRWDGAPATRGARSAPEGMDPSSAQIAARRRFEGAVAAAGPGLADVLWRVVCAGEGLEEAERGLGWPARAGKLVLALALDRVAGFYGL